MARMPPRPAGIAGVGIDLVEVARFERPSARLRERLFTPAERRYCDRQAHPAPHFAARFAAKEAVLKALGTGWSGGVAWSDVEIVRLEHGVAEVKLKGEAAARARKRKISRWHLSLTHTSSHAAAIAIAES
jgi:holo-[acyl-carrier protein] synthase